MNINQYQGCLNSIIALKNYDVTEIFFTSYPDENDLSKIAISKYNAAEFTELFERMIIQLDYELQSGLKLNLPNLENFQNEFGSIDLVNELPLFINYFENRSFPQLEPLLDKFIHYQVKNGFWSKTSIKSTHLQQERLNAQFQLISKNQKALEKNLNLFETLKSTLNSKILEIDNYIDSKRNDFEQISSLLNQSRIESNEITSILSNSSNRDTEISGILNNVKDKVTAIDQEIISYQHEFKTIKSQWENIESEFNDNQKQALMYFDKAKEHVEYTESRKEEIETLTGMAADGALGSKFHDRENKLTEKIPFWKRLIILMTLGTMIWVLIVFTCFPSKFDNEWVNLLVNLLKTTPVFILYGFVFKQYSKERNLEEEYAFKSAVAMTLTAYSRMLAEGDRDPNKSRQEMLLNSIENLYKAPKIHSEKSESLFSFNTKHLKDSVDAVNQSLNSLKGEV